MNAIIIGSSKSEIEILTSYLEKVNLINVVAVIENPDNEVPAINQEDVSLMFIGGELVGEKSFDVFDFFEQSIPVIAFSKEEKYAIKSFDAGVVDYLILPGSLDRFLRAVKRAERLANQRAPEVKDMYVRSNAKSLRVPFDSVLYIEAMADYVIIQTEDCKYIVHYTMKGIQDKLPADRFVRVHRSYILNMDKIHAIDNQEVIIKEKRIPIGASNKDYFFSRLNLI
ncbi:MAG: two component transcriptional regulator, LytTR family [Cytophagaceae bacterium]|jgi:DNA-binding LytR/AlgR family response regulator|nr:two component transcriptional regulator, LytTR family [Cytophagaceae bacterium]